MSNRDARKAATYIQEATVSPGLSPPEFTVRITVGAEGDVKDVSNPHSLPDALFAAAAEAARRWRFSSDRNRGKPRDFEAEITFHGPIAGQVTARDGTPVASVVVSGSEWKCCPPELDFMTTDNSGSFHIEHPGAVLHFLSHDRFQPQSLVVTSEMSNLKVTLNAASDRLSLARCREPQRGFERVGWGKYGLQFDVPRRDVMVKLGKTDVDYVVHIVKAKHGDDRVEFWFGPYAMTSTPDDVLFFESEAFTTRDVNMPAGLVPGSQGGVIGMDGWGRLPNGKMWRQMAAGAEGARYRDVSPEDAAIFDRIINSACWSPYPKH